MITPLIVGRRLTINPILILISLSFWGWIWGATGGAAGGAAADHHPDGARAAGKPDIAGFLFEQGTLTAHQEPPRAAGGEVRRAGAVDSGGGALSRCRASASPRGCSSVG